LCACMRVCACTCVCACMYVRVCLIKHVWKYAKTQIYETVVFGGVYYT